MNATPLLAGYITGWLVAAPIGPVNLEIMRRTLRFGWPQGLALGLGAVLIDLGYFTAFTLGLGALLQQPLVSALLNLFGALLLGWLGWSALRDALRLWRSRRNPVDGLSQETALRSVPSPWASLGTGLLMTGLNPMTIAFWSALSLGYAGMTVGERWLASLGVMAGCASWVALIVTLLTLARRRVGPGLFAVMTAAGGILLISFAVLSALRFGGSIG